MHKKLFLNILLVTFLFSLNGFVEDSFGRETGYSAMVMGMSGKVTVKGDRGNGEEKPLYMGQMLYPGDVVKTGKRSSVAINYLSPGREEEWPQNKTFTVGYMESVDTPKDVKVSFKKILLPEGVTYDQIGGHVSYSTSGVDYPGSGGWEGGSDDTGYGGSK